MIPNYNFSIRSFLGGYDQNFTYLISCSITNAQILIDASISIKKIIPFVNKNLKAVLITHSHVDHISNINQYIDFFDNIMIVGHPDSIINIKKKVKTVNHNQNFTIGKLNFTSIHTPGHYYDSICYKLNPVLFTGDTLFVGRTGRVVSKKSNINDLYNSIYKNIFDLPHDIRIYPGHDYGNQPTILLKDNIKISPLLNAKNRNDFIKKMKEYEDNRISNN